MVHGWSSSILFSDTWSFDFDMAVIIINDLLAWTVYSSIIFMCYYFCAIPMACVRIIFIKTRFKCRYPGFGWPWLLLVVTNEIRDHKLSDFWKFKGKSKIVRKTENAIISTFRVYILLFTIIAILAVDFQIFPKHFGKTTSYGVSVMDIGVGKVISIWNGSK